MFEKREYGENPTIETRHESHEKVDKKKRYRQITAILDGGKQLTAKEVAVEMFRRGYVTNTERNNSAPRLTEMSAQGMVEPVGKKMCKWTGKKVTVYALRT